MPRESDVVQRRRALDRASMDRLDPQATLEREDRGVFGLLLIIGLSWVLVALVAIAAAMIFGWVTP